MDPERWYDLARGIFQFKQNLSLITYTSELFNGVVTASMDLADLPSDCKLKMAVSGDSVNGTITITGSLDGVVQTETKTFTQSRTFYSDYLYDTIVSFVASAPLTGNNIIVNAVDNGHAEILTESTSTSHKCHFAPVNPASPVYRNPGIDEGTTVYYLRFKKGCPLTYAPPTIFEVDNYPGDRFKIHSKITPITHPTSRTFYEKWCYAIEEV